MENSGAQLTIRLINSTGRVITAVLFSRKALLLTQFVVDFFMSKQNGVEPGPDAERDP